MKKDTDLGIWVANETENYWDKGQIVRLIRFYNGYNDNWIKVFDMSGKKITEVYFTIYSTYFTPIDVVRQTKIDELLRNN
jgi:hypothetical protein